MNQSRLLHLAGILTEAKKPPMDVPDMDGDADDAPVAKKAPKGDKAAPASDAPPTKAEIIQQICDDTGLEETLEGKDWKKACSAIKKAFDAGVKSCSAK
jgi:hypothetical protein